MRSYAFQYYTYSWHINSRRNKFQSDLFLLLLQIDITVIRVCEDCARFIQINNCVCGVESQNYTVLIVVGISTVLQRTSKLKIKYIEKY